MAKRKHRKAPQPASFMDEILGGMRHGLEQAATAGVAAIASTVIDPVTGKIDMNAVRDIASGLRGDASPKANVIEGQKRSIVNLQRALSIYWNTLQAIRVLTIQMPPEAEPIRTVDADKLREIIRLHDEALRGAIEEPRVTSTSKGGTQ